jgi:hypothetical protein
MNSQLWTLPLFSIAQPFRRPITSYLRVAALGALSVFVLVGTLYAAGKDKNRFLETTQKLVEAINGNDISAIEAMLAPQMQQVLPADKAAPFFSGMVTAKGKLKEAGTPVIAGSAAIVKVSAERGAWDFKITLEDSGKIAGLLITPSAKAPRPEADDRFTKIAKRLVHAINTEHFSTIESMLDANMQKNVPLEKAEPFFRSVLTTNGKLKEPGAPTVTESMATLKVSAERGALDFKFSLDASDKITELRITPAVDSAPASGERFTTITKKLIDAINGEDIATIETMFDAQMQQAMPLDVAKPFFHSLVTGGGKLKDSGAPSVTGPTAIVRVSAERGAFDFKITLNVSDKISGLYITPSTSTSEGDSASVPRSHTSMHLPFHGEWYVFWGGDNEKVNHHVAVLGQRRAADLHIVGSDDSSHQGSGQRNEDYYAYGKEILAAAAGKVVTAIDGVPENVPGSMNPLCVVGNCVIIDQGQNEFALYAHLQPGSLRLHVGDQVQQGEVLGLCGNSGNSSEPHLHFHVQDSGVLQDGAGVTPYFTNVKCRRAATTLTDPEYTFLKGDRIESTSSK